MLTETSCVGVKEPSQNIRLHRDVLAILNLQAAVFVAHSGLDDTQGYFDREVTVGAVPALLAASHQPLAQTRSPFGAEEGVTASFNMLLPKAF